MIHCVESGLGLILTVISECNEILIWLSDILRYQIPPMTSTSRLSLVMAKLPDSDVHGLASGQKPKVLAWSWLWPGLGFLKAKAKGPGHGFEHYFLKQLLSIIITLTVA